MIKAGTDGRGRGQSGGGRRPAVTVDACPSARRLTGRRLQPDPRTRLLQVDLRRVDERPINKSKRVSSDPRVLDQTGLWKQLLSICRVGGNASVGGGDIIQWRRKIGVSNLTGVKTGAALTGIFNKPKKNRKECKYSQRGPRAVSV